MDNKNYAKEKIVNLNLEMQGILECRVRTAFIGALDQFEKIFSEYGALEKDDDDASITEAQEKFYDLYVEFRKRLMDFGNHQIRIGKSEINKKLGDNGKNE